MIDPSSRTVLASTLRPVLVAALATALLVLPMAAVSHATGKRTQTWSNKHFDAAMTINWVSKRKFTVRGWVEDTGCDRRKVYGNLLFGYRKNAEGRLEGIGLRSIPFQDANGCDNGRRTMARRTVRFDQPVGYVKEQVCAQNDAGARCYIKRWNNPLVSP